MLKQFRIWCRRTSVQRRLFSMSNCRRLACCSDIPLHVRKQLPMLRCNQRHEQTLAKELKICRRKRLLLPFVGPLNIDRAIYSSSTHDKKFSMKEQRFLHARFFESRITSLTCILCKRGRGWRKQDRASIGAINPHQESSLQSLRSNALPL